VQGGNLVVEGIAALVETAGVDAEHLGQKVLGDLAGFACQRGGAGLFQQIEKAPCIAIGIAGEGGDGCSSNSSPSSAPLSRALE
jgi:hypothetical protein